MARVIDLRKKEAVSERDAKSPPAATVSKIPKNKTQPPPASPPTIAEDKLNAVPEPPPASPTPSALLPHILFPTTISWEMVPFTHHPSGNNMRIVVGALFLMAALFWLVWDDILMGVILLMGGVVLALNRTRQPEFTPVTVNDSGVAFGDHLYKYSELDSFWINYTAGGVKELSIRTASWYAPYIKVPLENMDPVQIRNLMVQFIPEQEHPQNLIDDLVKFI